MMFFVAFLTIFTVVVVSNQSENTSRFVDQVRQKNSRWPGATAHCNHHTNLLEVSR